MHEIYAADTRVDIRHVRVNATPEEVLVQIGHARYTTHLASASIEHLRRDATVAAECAAAWHRMSGALTLEADRREAALVAPPTPVEGESYWNRIADTLAGPSAGDRIAETLDGDTPAPEPDPEGDAPEGEATS